MERILEKISNYHLFNNLVPGVIFIITSDYILETNIYNDNLLYLFFISYFIGIIISRFGSLVTANILYKFTKEKGESYKNYIISCQKDDKIEVLMQDKNMYRNLCTMLILLLVLKLFSMLKVYFKINNDWMIIIILVILIILFAISFLKQNKYISSRIRANKKLK